jgi:cobalt-zinc-cadmium efflux system outer membrane protein
VGKGLQGAVLKAQVSLSSLAGQMIRLKQQRRGAEAQLNGILHRLPQAEVGRPAGVSMTVISLDVDSLQMAALEHRALLHGITSDVDRWSVAEDLARRQYRPDFDVSVAYRQRDFVHDPVKGSDFVSAGVMVNLPIYAARKQDQQVVEARHQRMAAEARFQAARLRLFERIQTLHVDLQAHREQAALFEAVIIPQAKQSLAAAMVGYQVDKVDFLSLLDSQVQLLNFEVDHYRHLAEHEKALAALEAEVGKRLF